MASFETDRLSDALPKDSTVRIEFRDESTEPANVTYMYPAKDLGLTELNQLVKSINANFGQKAANVKANREDEIRLEEIGAELPEATNAFSDVWARYEEENENRVEAVVELHQLQEKLEELEQGQSDFIAEPKDALSALEATPADDSAPTETASDRPACVDGAADLEEQIKACTAKQHNLEYELLPPLTEEVRVKRLAVETLKAEQTEVFSRTISRENENAQLQAMIELLVGCLCGYDRCARIIRTIDSPAQGLVTGYFYDDGDIYIRKGASVITYPSSIPMQLVAGGQIITARRNAAKGQPSSDFTPTTKTGLLYTNGARIEWAFDQDTQSFTELSTIACPGRAVIVQGMEIQVWLRKNMEEKKVISTSFCFK